MRSRRAFLGQCIMLAAAPAIVRASSLMPVRAWGYGTLALDNKKLAAIVSMTEELLLDSPMRLWVNGQLIWPCRAVLSPR